MTNLLKKVNTTLTVITTVYAVGKFMYETFKKYEKKHGKGYRQLIGRKEKPMCDDI